MIGIIVSCYLVVVMIVIMIQYQYTPSDMQHHHFNYRNVIIITVDAERFAGLNIHGFNPTEVFVEILLHCLDQNCPEVHII